MKTIKTIHLIRAFVCIYVLAAGLVPIFSSNTCFYLTFQCLFIETTALAFQLSVSFCMPLAAPALLFAFCCPFQHIKNFGSKRVRRVINGHLNSGSRMAKKVQDAV